MVKCKPRTKEKLLGYMAANSARVGECQIWLRSKNAGGYGIVFHPFTRLAHRLAYILTHGEFDPKLRVCHTCDTPACINVSHLFLGTQRENVADMIRKGRYHTGPSRSGEACPTSKLTARNVADIKREYAQTIKRRGLPPRLALKYGVTPAAIYDILSGKTWRHIV